MQIAAVGGKIGNPRAECKFGHVVKRVIDKQELQEGLCWRRRGLSGMDVRWRGDRKSWLVVRLCSRCSGGGEAISWGTGHRAVLMWTKGWENKAVRWCTVFCSPSAKLICSYRFFSTCHWHLLIATGHTASTNGKTSKIALIREGLVLPLPILEAGFWAGSEFLFDRSTPRWFSLVLQEAVFTWS